jgi:hypothetical protein
MEALKTFLFDKTTTLPNYALVAIGLALVILLIVAATGKHEGMWHYAGEYLTVNPAAEANRLYGVIVRPARV